MKTKIVLWGKNAQDERVLLASELNADDNLVITKVFGGEAASDSFHDNLNLNWANHKAIEDMPEHDTQQKTLSISESFLPDGIEAEDTVLLAKTSTEWNYSVLRNRMYQQFKGEIEMLSDKVDQLEKYSKPVWEELRGFWGKVVEQIKERNIIKEHGDDLRKSSDELFGKMKQMRKTMDKEFKQKSQAALNTIAVQLDDIEQRMPDQKQWRSIFNELKDVQRQFKQSKFTREDGNKLWARIDGAFKSVKAKMFGEEELVNTGNKDMDRLVNRRIGLTNAINKVQRSLERDEKDLKFENRRIDRTDGQLEAQLRAAKVNMIEARIASKKEKIADIQKTLEGVETKIEKQKKRDEERARQEEAKARNLAEIEAKRQQSEAQIEANKEKLQRAVEALQDKDPEEAKTAADTKPVQSIIEVAAQAAPTEAGTEATVDDVFAEEDPTGANSATRSRSVEELAADAGVTIADEPTTTNDAAEALAEASIGENVEPSLPDATEAAMDDADTTATLTESPAAEEIKSEIIVEQNTLSAEVESSDADTDQPATLDEAKLKSGQEGEQDGEFEDPNGI